MPPSSEFEIGRRVIGRRGIEAVVKETRMRGRVLMLRVAWLESADKGIVSKWVPAEEVVLSGRQNQPPSVLPDAKGRTTPSHVKALRYEAWLRKIKRGV